MTEKGFGPAVLDKTTQKYAAIRGREQQLINFHGGAQKSGGTSGNSYNRVSNRNILKPFYMSQATSEFGGLPDNSSQR
jgi:hypothetical protein